MLELSPAAALPAAALPVAAPGALGLAVEPAAPAVDVLPAVEVPLLGLALGAPMVALANVHWAPAADALPTAPAVPLVPVGAAPALPRCRQPVTVTVRLA
jgi:hypothetical protein